MDGFGANFSYDVGDDGSSKGARFKRGLFTFLKYAVLVIACLIVFVPLIVVFLGSLKNNTEFLSSNVFALPTAFEWSNYKTAFIDGKVLLGLKNTAIIILISCTGTIITGTMTAYVLQRFKTLFGKVLKAAFLLATLFPAISMQVTVYRIMNGFHLVGTMAAPIILYVGTDIISIYIFMQFLDNISTSLDESAIMDGANYFTVYFRIILPLLKPAIATVLIIKVIGIYNDFYTPQLYMPSDELSVVSTSLYRFMGPYGAKWEIIFAGIVICIIPTLVIFISLQKQIYAGLVNGSVKE
ncbi:MAG: carbohydrate ABC transporter permease [Oscillospiraceae bacterium]|jgi:multiple sugar transport system permease protein|nr:carbohydrate ABC transporter permease [Oscillospiraceae bacterium]MCX4255381.1 carbohydrate ABC transporter permease [Oscillospiraceae bacterium]